MLDRKRQDKIRGHGLQRIMIRNNLTNEAAARLIGVSESCVNKWCSGKNGIRREMESRICQRLGIPADYFRRYQNGFDRDDEVSRSTEALPSGHCLIEHSDGQRLLLSMSFKQCLRLMHRAVDYLSEPSDDDGVSVPDGDD